MLTNGNCIYFIFHIIFNYLFKNYFIILNYKDVSMYN